MSMTGRHRELRKSGHGVRANKLGMHCSVAILPHLASTSGCLKTMLPHMIGGAILLR